MEKKYINILPLLVVVGNSKFWYVYIVRLSYCQNIFPYVLLLVLHNHLWRPKKGVKFRGINSCVDKLALSYLASTICCWCSLSPLLGCQTATILGGGPDLRSNGNQCSGFFLLKDDFEKDLQKEVAVKERTGHEILFLLYQTKQQTDLKPLADKN